MLTNESDVSKKSHFEVESCSCSIWRVVVQECLLIVMFDDGYQFSLMVIFDDLVGQGSEIFLHVDHKQLQLLSRRDG